MTITITMTDIDLAFERLLTIAGVLLVCLVSHKLHASVFWYQPYYQKKELQH